MNARKPLGLLMLIFSLTFTTPPALAEAENPEAGQAIYERACVGCHGMDGKGGRLAGRLAVAPRNLADKAYMQTRSTKQLFAVIKHGSAAQGLSPAMPGFGSQLTDTQIRDTVAYVTTLSDVASPTAGAVPAGVPTAQPAPAALRLARLHLSIWPEYDDPRVLIIMRGEVAPAGAVPTKIALPIPKGAELIGAGMISDQNALLNHPHRIIPGDAHDTLELTLPVPRFFAEWYYNPFATRGTERQFAYTLRLSYPLDELNVDIQQPYEATDFHTEPEAMDQKEDDRGGTYNLFTYRDVEAGQKHTFTVRYVKTTDRPSIAKQQPSSRTRPPPSLWRNPTMLAFGMLAGVTAIYASCVFLWRNRRQHQNPSWPSASRQAPPPATPASPRANFCPNCGRKLQPPYHFCPGCGRPLQRG